MFQGNPTEGGLREQAVPLAVAIAERARATLRLVLVSVARVPVTAPVPLGAEMRRLYVSLEIEARESEEAYLEAFTDHLKRQAPTLAISRQH